MSARKTAAALILVAIVSSSAAAQTAATGSNNNYAPPNAPAGGQLKAIDAGLTRAESMVLDLEVLAKGGIDGSGCPTTMSVGSYLSDLRNKRATKTGNDVPDSPGANGSGPKLDFQMYYLCKALAQKNPAACDALAAVSAAAPDAQHSDAGAASPRESAAHGLGQSVSSASYDGKCRRAYTKESARAAFIARSPRFMDLCRDDMNMQAPAVRQGPTADAICTAWWNYGGDQAPLAAALSAGISRPVTGGMLTEIVAEMTADPAACAQFTREFDRKTCAEQQDYRRALAAKSPSACRGGICRVLMGDGERACEPYAVKFKAPACAQGISADYVAERGQAFKDVSDDIEAELAKSNAGIGEAKALKEFNERLDKLSDLRARFDAAAEKIAPTVNKKAATARGKKKPSAGDATQTP